VADARTTVAVEILEAPLAGWRQLPASAASAYWDLVATAVAIDRRLAEAGGRRVARIALRVSIRRPTPASRAVASTLLTAAQVATGVRRRVAGLVGRGSHPSG
jgi:hypothetical protein